MSAELRQRGGAGLLIIGLNDTHVVMMVCSLCVPTTSPTNRWPEQAPWGEPQDQGGMGGNCRQKRTGFPEVVWGVGKSPLQIVTIMRKLIERDQLALATRVEPHVRPSTKGHMLACIAAQVVLTACQQRNTCRCEPGKDL